MLSENPRSPGHVETRLRLGILRKDRPSRSASTAVLLGLSLVMAAATGCDHATPGGSTASAQQTVTKTSSEELLRSALNLLQEEEQEDFTIDPGGQQRSAFPRVRELLNQWLQTGGSQEQPILDTAVRQRLEQVLEEDELSEIESDRFTEGDAEHLRNCFLLRDVAMRAQGDAALVLDRARKVFEWVLRNLHPVDREEERGHLLLGSYYAMLTGRGIAQERAWLFVLLLRQLKIDAVLVAHGDPNDTERYVPWAVGVLDQGAIHLFDFRQGRPVSDAAGEGLLTLKAAARDPQSIQQAWRDGEALDPNRPAVFLESDPAYWAPRMHLLESKLLGDQAAVLAYSIDALARRIAEAAGEEIEDRITLWPLPIQVARQLRNPQFEQPKLQFLGPCALFSWFVNTRVHQLRGEWEKAIPDLQRVNVFKEHATQATSSQRRYLAQASEAATYWLGVSTFEQGELDVASHWLHMYLDRYGEHGRWAPGAKTLLEQIEEKRPPEAIESSATP